MLVVKEHKKMREGKMADRLEGTPASTVKDLTEAALGINSVKDIYGVSVAKTNRGTEDHKS